MFGFTVSKNGILTDNYYKKYGYSEDPEPLGAYIMIRKIGHEIKINQDFMGSYGIYLYESKNTEYFAISNSFLLLQEYLNGKQNISFNKDFADNLLISDLCSPLIHETLINEIIRLPSNTFLVINPEKKTLKILYIDYKENTIPFESEEGIKLIDSWVDKWGYILRSLKNKTNNIYADLSGGFDTRSVLSMLLNSGVNLSQILVNSAMDNVHGHDEDFKIANEIASKFGFKLNNFTLNNDKIRWGSKNTLSCTMYSKLGFHKEFYLKESFYNVPRFGISGSGGEIIRGATNFPINEYVKSISSKAKNIIGHENEFFNSSMRICNRSIEILKDRKTFNNDFEISLYFYSKGRARNHFGTSSVEAFIANIYILQPLMDPDLIKLRYNINRNLSHDLISYLYVRFGKGLINFPFEGNRNINLESIKKSIILNSKISPFKTKSDYNSYFFIDNMRKCPEFESNDKKDSNIYLREYFNSSKFKEIINKIYDNNIYNWAKKYSYTTNFFPYRHYYGLLAISTILGNISFIKDIIK